MLRSIMDSVTLEMTAGYVRACKRAIADYIFKAFKLWLSGCRLGRGQSGPCPGALRALVRARLGLRPLRGHRGHRRRPAG